MNQTERCNSFKTILNIWSQRDLSIKGKIVVLKSIALAQLHYATFVLYVPEEFIDKVDKDI